MYSVSDKYKKKILDPVRKFESEIRIGSTTLTNEEVISFSMEQSIQQDATFSIGNTISTSFNLIFFHNDTITINDEDLVEAKLGLKLDDEIIEYVPLGVFNIDNLEMNDSTISISTYDNMVKFEVPYIEDSENPTVYSVINKLQELTKVNFGGDLNKYKNYNLSVLQNYSCREVLGFIAGVLGANAIINREGKFDFIAIGNEPVCSINPDNYLDYTKKNKVYKISRITNNVDTEELTLGNDDNMQLSMSNPHITEDILKDISNSINGLEFLPYSVVWSGNMALDLGDLITITDKKGNVITHPILSHSMSYNGALSCIVMAQGETSLANTYKSTSQEENDILRNNNIIVNLEKGLEGFITEVSDATNNLQTQITQNTKSITTKVDNGKVISSINQSAEAVKIKANKIQLEGAVTVANTNGDSIKINNGDYEIRSDSTVKGFLGLRQLDDNYAIPRLALGQDGLSKASNDYFVIQSYPKNNNPQNYAYPYVDIAYRLQKHKGSDGFGDVSNIKMYGDGTTRVSPVKTLEITTNFKNGSYNGEGESLVAEFGSSSSEFYDKYMDIPTIRNTQTTNGLILAHRNANNQSCFVRVNCDSNGDRFFRPLTGDGNISLGSGNFPWKQVYSKTTYSSNGIVVSDSDVRVVNNDDILDNINFISPMNNDEGLIVDVTNIKNTCYVDSDEGNVYLNNSEIVKLLLKEVKKLKEEINILKNK